MTPEEKSELADAIIRLVQDRMTSNDMPILIGTLSKPQGINGFKKAEVGHPVFEHKDRYIIYLESLDGKTAITIPYYKETLRLAINFNQ
jgi:hypothetical protein